MNETKKNAGSSGVSVGGATMVMLFSVLCLTIFSVLALVTANNEWKLAQKSADAISAYYAADSQAARVYHSLSQAGEVSDGAEIEGITVSAQDDIIMYTVPIDEAQQLEVMLCAVEDGWEVLTWKVVRTAAWEADETIEVWEGEGILF